MSDPAAYLDRLRAVNDRLAAWPAELRMPERNPRSLVQPHHVGAALDVGKNRLAGILERILIAQEVESRARVGRSWERRLEVMNRRLQQQVEELKLQAADFRAIVVEAGRAGLVSAETVAAVAAPSPEPHAPRPEPNPPRPLYEPVRRPAKQPPRTPDVRDTSAAREAMLVLLAEHPDLLDQYGERLGLFAFTDPTARHAARLLVTQGSLSEEMRTELRGMLSVIDSRAFNRNIRDLEARAEGIEDLLRRTENSR